MSRANSILLPTYYFVYVYQTILIKARATASVVVVCHEDSQEPATAYDSTNAATIILYLSHTHTKYTLLITPVASLY